MQNALINRHLNFNFKQNYSQQCQRHHWHRDQDGTRAADSSHGDKKQGQTSGSFPVSELCFTGKYRKLMIFME